MNSHSIGKEPVQKRAVNSYSRSRKQPKQKEDRRTVHQYISRCGLPKSKKAISEEEKVEGIILQDQGAGRVGLITASSTVLPRRAWRVRVLVILVHVPGLRIRVLCLVLLLLVLVLMLLLLSVDVRSAS